MVLVNRTSQKPSLQRDLRLVLTDALQVLKPDKSFYGVFVSQHIYDMLELRTALAPTEVPLMSILPVAVDPSFLKNQWQKVITREEWLKRTARK